LKCGRQKKNKTYFGKSLVRGHLVFCLGKFLVSFYHLCWASVCLHRNLKYQRPIISQVKLFNHSSTYQTLPNEKGDIFLSGPDLTVCTFLLATPANKTLNLISSTSAFLDLVQCRRPSLAPLGKCPSKLHSTDTTFPRSNTPSQIQEYR
jgi:hypothetical protein